MFSTVAKEVFGQADFDSVNANRSGSVTADSLNFPAFLTVSSSTVCTSDYLNNRLMCFSPGNANATNVFGQLGSFTSDLANNSGTPASADSLNGPRGIFSDSTGLLLADSLNHRVLFYSTGSTTASRVYGQSGSFTLNSPNLAGPSNVSLLAPRGVCADATGVYIADTSNNRVLFFPGTAVNATRVYGQPNMGESSANNPAISASSLNQPWSVYCNGSGLYISDTLNHRVLYFAGTATIATRVYGQTDFTSNQANGGGGVGPQTLNEPKGVFEDATGVYVADSLNNRVLFYPGTANSPVRVYGQADYVQSSSGTGRQGLNRPEGVASAGSEVFIADTFNHRVLAY